MPLNHPEVANDQESVDGPSVLAAITAAFIRDPHIVICAFPGAVRYEIVGRSVCVCMQTDARVCTCTFTHAPVMHTRMRACIARALTRAHKLTSILVHAFHKPVVRVRMNLACCLTTGPYHSRMRSRSLSCLLCPFPSVFPRLSRPETPLFCSNAFIHAHIHTNALKNRRTYTRRQQGRRVTKISGAVCVPPVLADVRLTILHSNVCVGARICVHVFVCVYVCVCL